jgi:hydroxymethylpyrimidine pyrophosphatase-like HAD family hydrolase
MENAVETLKEKLSHLEIIASNDNDGVATYLHQKIVSTFVSK